LRDPAGEFVMKSSPGNGSVTPIGPFPSAQKDTQELECLPTVRNQKFSLTFVPDDPQEYKDMPWIIGAFVVLGFVT